MKNNLIFSILLLPILIMSCATSTTNQHKAIFMKDMDQIQLGLAKDRVTSVLGIPNEIDPPSEKVNSEAWFYYGVGDRNWQKGAITFDSKTQLVDSKTYIPFDDEFEFSLDYLLQKKFAGLHFEKGKLKRCNRDYMPLEAYYVNVANGIAIKHNEYKKYVQTIIWFSSDEAKKLLEDIKSCKK